jgi:hypothetical protein
MELAGVEFGPHSNTRQTAHPNQVQHGAGSYFVLWSSFNSLQKNKKQKHLKKYPKDYLIIDNTLYN